MRQRAEVGCCRHERDVQGVGTQRVDEVVRAGLAELDLDLGVAAVEARVVADVTLNVPRMEEPAVGHFVGLPDRGNGLRLNRLHLRSGRLADPATPGEVVAGEVFAVAHGLQPGDVIRAVLGRNRSTAAWSGSGNT